MSTEPCSLLTVLRTVFLSAIQLALFSLSLFLLTVLGNVFGIYHPPASSKASPISLSLSHFVSMPLIHPHCTPTPILFLNFALLLHFDFNFIAVRMVDVW